MSTARMCPARPSPSGWPRWTGCSTAPSPTRVACGRGRPHGSCGFALEQVVDELWVRVAPELMRCPMRAQLLALRTFAGPLTAARIATLWSALSHAAHHHDYELAPGVTELRRWREETARIADELAAIR